ncbi:MAG: hypothetical protein J3R72DRAFT_421692 [Linnemannia gamsii]|nr:MAG: hypothetical protein J3R72DRAFT_421692 [Linnemannia gamsii]
MAAFLGLENHTDTVPVSSAPAAIISLLAANAAGVTSSSAMAESSSPSSIPIIPVSSSSPEVPPSPATSQSLEQGSSSEVIPATPDSELFEAFSEAQSAEILALIDHTRKDKKKEKEKATKNDYNNRVIDSAATDS